MGTNGKVNTNMTRALTLAVALCGALIGCSGLPGRARPPRKTAVVTLYDSSDSAATAVFPNAGTRAVDEARVEFGVGEQVHFYSRAVGSVTVSSDEMPAYFSNVFFSERLAESPTLKVAVFFERDARYQDVFRKLSALVSGLKASGREVMVDTDFVFVDYQ